MNRSSHDDAADGAPRRRLSEWAMIAIAAIAIFAALRAGEAIFAPVLLAFVFGIVLSPMTDMWERLGLRPLAAAILNLTLGLATLVAIIFALEPLARNLIRLAPKIRSDLRYIIRQAREFMNEFTRLTESMVETVSSAPVDGDSAAEVPVPNVTDALFMAPGYAAQMLVFVGTLFFFLLTRDELYAWISKQVGPRDMTNEVARRLRRAEAQVSRYFLTILVINACLGAAVAIALTLIGMPSALTWGLLAGLLNFILYLGPATVAVSLALGGIASFDGYAAFLPPLIYLGLNMVEAQFVTPTFVGRQLSVNPLMVFLALVFWLWLWGPIGGFVAIPLLLWLMAMIRMPGNEAEDQTIASGTPGSGLPKRSAGPES